MIKWLKKLFRKKSAFEKYLSKNSVKFLYELEGDFTFISDQEALDLINKYEEIFSGDKNDNQT